MTRDQVLARIRDAGLIPVLRAAAAAEALRLAEALVDGGLAVLEVALTVPEAPAVIRALAGRPGLCVGAGSVLGGAQAAEAIAAGAQFLVSPALDLEVMAQARARQVAVLPGALTPGEVVRAHRAGADLVKLFPAGAVGGPAYVRALRGPLPDVPLVPTGGVTLDTVADYFAAGAIAVGAGSELADAAAVRRGDAQAVAATARAWLHAVRSARA